MKNRAFAQLTRAKEAASRLAQRTHCAEPLRVFLREAEALPSIQALPESLALQALRHGLRVFIGCRDTYRAVMGRDCPPSSEQVARAMLDPRYRAELLAEWGAS